MKDHVEQATSGFAEMLDRVADRAAAAVMAKGRVRSNALRCALLDRLRGTPGTEDGFLADPVFEAAREWLAADVTLDELAGSVLEEDLVSALDTAEKRRSPRSGTPYMHQLQAWEAAEAGRSFLVTSGTGSGKTECFMVPMLNDLLRQSPTGRRRGVQAIILYPLNALIDSQRERLGAWVEPLSSRITYALYNKYLVDSLQRHEWPGGGQVPDRRRLRDDPPSILVTNVTMLEYMLMRAQDAPVLEQSQGTLRWIVLDEAHSYVGAQAAEMALLLRRVRQAFGVAPEDVRLAATSATIGEGGETREMLRRFVADLGGVSTDRVDVIEGRERTPDLPPEGGPVDLVTEALSDDESALWNTLAPDPRVRDVRARMRDKGIALGEATQALGLGAPDDPQARHRTFSVLEAAARAQDPSSGLRLSPWRLHVFHRAQAGIWVCVDPDCPSRDPALSEQKADWFFGQAYTEARERCSCGAPVFELGACDECGTPWAMAERYSAGLHEYLGQSKRADDEDEYVLEVEPDPVEDGESPGTLTPSREVLLAAGGDRPMWLRLEDGALLNTPEEGDRVAPVSIVEEPGDRACCARAHDARVTVRPQRFGAPFLLGNAMPVLLEAVAPLQDAEIVPFGGRRLLSFTDSRQGTARFAAKLQQEAERNLTRSVIYHAVQEAGGADPDVIAELESTIAALEPLVAQTPALQGTLDEKRRDLAAASDGAGRVSWAELKACLAGNPELEAFAGDVWRGRPMGGDHLAQTPPDLAELFLFRELFRRPRLQNNVETMALARLVFPRLEEAARSTLPGTLAEAGHDAGVWADVLHAALDIVFRATLAVDLPTTPVDVRHWIAPRSALSEVFEPGTPPDAIASVRTPTRFPTSNATRSSLVQLLFRLTDGTPDSVGDAERVDRVLAAIWSALKGARVLKSTAPHAWRLELKHAAVARIDTAWRCPRTWRVLPYAPARVSLNALDSEAHAEPVPMPRLPDASPVGLTADARARIRNWLASNDAVVDLREAGHWTNLHDRVAEFAPYLRAQEHSAQIDRPSLKTYEADFEKGRINVLACSTTMEMGVDIPDVGMVVNTNVPPAPANYRQRIGRAGRRGEPWALAFTFCKDLPLDRMIFREPERLLKGEMRAPAVRLDSAVLVQRHVNSALLGMFLREHGGIRVSTQVGTFFGATNDPAAPWRHDNQAAAFLVALQGDWASSDDISGALQTLVRGTALQGQVDVVLRAETAFTRLRNRWMGEYGQLLTAQAAYPENALEHRFYANRARRMREEFMMSELARRGFTPAYGFPVDVVAFDHVGRPGDEGGPSRPLDLAIRDYSPGCEIVIDGLVHRSEGVLPTWGNRMDPGSVEDLRTLWRCRSCNAFGTSRRNVDACPSCKGAVERQEILRPSGFLGTKAPHSAYEALDFVPPDRTRVTAGAVPWSSLPDPEAGACRGNREGRVLATSSGPAGHGYALCITCGRAQPETDAEAEAPLPKGMREHDPLQRPRENPRADGKCPGNDPGARKIRRHLRLGTEMTTDVFEFRLDALDATKQDLGCAMAIGSALREAVSARLGVDAEQMGVASAPAMREDGSRRASLFLYDRASGGSGFAVTAEGDLPGLLKAAAERLNCPSDCAHGCPDCILRRDLQFEMGSVDRPRAHDLLRKEVLPRLALPDRLRVFGPATAAITQTLSTWLRQKIVEGRLTSLTLFLHGEAKDWDLMDWAGTDIMAIAARSAARVRLALPMGEVAKLERAQKLDIVRGVSRSSADLHAVRVAPTIADLPILAEAEMDGQAVRIAVASPEASRIDPAWGNTSGGPALWGASDPTDLGNRLSLEKLAEFGEGNSKRIDIRDQLDGALTSFGSKFWKTVSHGRPQAFAGKRAVVKATYSDRYLRTPLTARLLREVVQKMPGRTEATAIEIVSERSAWAGSEEVRALHHSWGDDDLRKDVLREMLPRAAISLRAKSDCPHARSLRMEFEDGSAVTVHLDQRFGAWRTAGRHAITFDGSADPQAQARKLVTVTANVELHRGDQHASPLWVSW